MPKNPPPPPGRTKIRVFYVDADFAPGDMEKFTEALTQAVRPEGRLANPAIVRRLSTTSTKQHEEAAEVSDGADAELEEVEEVDAEEVSTAPATRSPSKPRRYRVPNVLPLIDLENPPMSWPDFVAEKKPGESVPDRYLTVAAWFKWHRNTDAIGIDHVYTCFLHPKVKWSTVIDDFDALLRYHKKRGRMKKAGKGLYAINQIGLGEVDEFAAQKG